MTVTILHATPLQITDQAISKCWDKPCDPDNVNYAKIERVGNKFKHASTLEHTSYSFDIDGISRACLQELARHRIASYSVKSSRYTLAELKDAPIQKMGGYDLTEFSKFCVVTGNSLVDNASAAALVALQDVLNTGIANDRAKYCMPESYRTSLVMTINARSLQNFLSLRSGKSALWEIQDLASAMYSAIPEEHKFLFNYIYEKED